VLPPESLYFPVLFEFSLRIVLRLSLRLSEIGLYLLPQTRHWQRQQLLPSETFQSYCTVHTWTGRIRVRISDIVKTELELNLVWIYANIPTAKLIVPLTRPFATLLATLLHTVRCRGPYMFITTPLA
jgi:hypothetical protein